jgi:hypothetical protein
VVNIPQQGENILRFLDDPYGKMEAVDISMKQR